MMWLALGAITTTEWRVLPPLIAVGLTLLFLAWRVVCGDFDGTPYPAMNGSKLEAAIREQLAKDKKE